MIPLIRRCLLNHLGASTKVQMVVLAICDYTEGMGTDRVRLSLDQLSGLMGHAGQWKFAQRALNEKERFESRLNITICKDHRGERNVRRVTQFSDNRLNVAAAWILQSVSSDTRTLNTIAKIEEYCETAVVKFLRNPLATTAHPKAKAAPGRVIGKGGSVISLDAGDLISAVSLGLTLPDPICRIFPVENKIPRIWRWQQAATFSQSVISGWARRWPGTSWAILCGVRIADGFLTVIDKDRHGKTFGDGFKTVTMREGDLGPLPETFTVTTAGNGEHLYFSSTKPLPTTHDVLGPGLDCKSAGGFIVAPGSPGYQIAHDLAIAQLPGEWEKALAVVQQPKRLIA